MVFQLADAKKCAAFLFSGPSSSKGELVPSGTCFFVEITDVEGGSSIDYLITARHVLEDLRRAAKGFVRLNKPGGGVSYREISLEERDWLCHTDGAVDVAILLLGEDFGPPADEIDFLNLDAPLAGDLGFLGMLREADDVAFTGLMVNFVGEMKNLLALRVGTVALVTDEPIKGVFGPSSYHVINAQTYPGNSGAPVWVVYAQSFFLLGVLSAGWPAIELSQTDKSSWRKTEYYNLGMSLVTPLEKVLEILMGQVLTPTA